MLLKDTPAIVTGGASGLGAATVRALAKAGARVTLFDLNDELGAAVAAETGARAEHVDVSDEASVNAALDRAGDAHGEARILINCAGIAIGMKTVSKKGPHSLAAFEKVLRVNLIGTFNCIRLAAARMAELEPLADGERGVVVNTASIAGYEGQIGQVAYSASKGGIIGMTLPIARDLADVGVRCCTIAPGLFKTPLMASLPEEVQQSLGDSVPFPRRLGDPSEYAALAQHIVENPMINGEVIRLDGALRLPPR